MVLTCCSDDARCASDRFRQHSAGRELPASRADFPVLLPVAAQSVGAPPVDDAGTLDIVLVCVSNRSCSSCFSSRKTSRRTSSSTARSTSTSSALVATLTRMTAVCSSISARRFSSISADPHRITTDCGRPRTSPRASHSKYKLDQCWVDVCVVCLELVPRVRIVIQVVL